MNLEPLDYLPAVTLDRLYTQLETKRYLSRAMTLGHHSQHLDLSGRELVERATKLDGPSDRSGELAEICLCYQILSARADAGDGRVAVDGSCDEDQRGRGPDAAKQLQRGLSVEHPE